MRRTASASVTRRAVLGALGALPAATVRAAQVTLKVGDQIGGSQAVMEAAGVLDGLPYRLDWAQFAAAAPLLEALGAGAIDIGGASDAPTTFALAAGAPVRIVGAYRANPASTAIIVPAASPLHDVADLRGKRVGTGRGSVGHALLLSALRANGMRPEDISFRSLLPPDAHAALKSGAIDAWPTWGLYVAQATLKDNERVLVDGTGLLSGLSYQSATIAAVAGKRAALADYLARLGRAQLWANAHLDSYAAQWARLVHVDVTIARDNLNRQNPRPVPIDAQVVADQQRTADLWMQAGIITKQIDATGYFDASFNAAVPA